MTSCQTRGDSLRALRRGVAALPMNGAWAQRPLGADHQRATCEALAKFALDEAREVATTAFLARPSDRGGKPSFMPCPVSLEAHDAAIPLHVP